MLKIITKSEEATQVFAKKYAETIGGGDVIGLIGDLGAGKTVFTRGLAEAFGIKRSVNSPTFTLMKVYKIPKKESSIKHLVHIDAYRLKNAQELSSIGAEEYFGRVDTVTIIEWADKIKKILPKKTRFIKLKHDKDNKRIIYY